MTIAELCVKRPVFAVMLTSVSAHHSCVWLPMLVSTLMPCRVLLANTLFEIEMVATMRELDWVRTRPSWVFARLVIPLIVIDPLLRLGAAVRDELEKRQANPAKPSRVA